MRAHLGVRNIDQPSAGKPPAFGKRHGSLKTPRDHSPLDRNQRPLGRTLSQGSLVARGCKTDFGVCFQVGSPKMASAFLLVSSQTTKMIGYHFKKRHTHVSPLESPSCSIQSWLKSDRMEDYLP